MALDVTNNDDVVKAVKARHERLGRNDVVVNNAGYANLAAPEDIAIDDFRAQVDASFLGDVYVTNAVLPILRRQGSGHILLVSSLGGRLSSPGLCAYQACKWAVGGFSSVLSSNVKLLDVNITVLKPGGMKTTWSGGHVHGNSCNQQALQAKPQSGRDAPIISLS